MTFNRLPAAAALAIASLAASAGPAFAHHAMGGETPDTLFAGLLSGLAHPVIGIDHLAFVVAAGVASALGGNRLLTPLAFVVATLAGCLLTVGNVALPAVELVVAASILALGGLVLSGRTLGTTTLLALLAGAGVFHGWAYGESIVGAESTPLTAYLVGFAAVQYAIAVGAGAVAVDLWRSPGPDALRPRLVGAAVAGIGFTFLVENVESLLMT